MSAMEATRVDQWLWAIRIFTTRSEATEACRGGHVRINGRPAKPASPVRPGDRVEANAHRRDRIVEVITPIQRRVGASAAAECFVDHSPPPPPNEYVRRLFPRPAGAGRPTKKERRQTDRFRTQ
jgi:ribosome-associated heat shock protein Hsp15